MGVIGYVPQWTDAVLIRNFVNQNLPGGIIGTGHQDIPVNFDAFIQGLKTDPSGNTEVVSDQTINLATLSAAAYFTILTVPAGAFIEYLGMIVGVTVTVTGNATLLGLGQEASAPGTYGVTTSLVAGQSIQVARVGGVSSSTLIQLCGISSGTTLTTGTLTGGIVRIVCKYLTPNVLAYPAPQYDTVGYVDDMPYPIPGVPADPWTPPNAM